MQTLNVKLHQVEALLLKEDVLRSTPIRPMRLTKLRRTLCRLLLPLKITVPARLHFLLV